MRIGSWVDCTIIMIRNPRNTIGNYLGPYGKQLLGALCGITVLLALQLLPESVAIKAVGCGA